MDRIRKDEAKNLIVCPLPYDGAFMQIFYNAWGIVRQFVTADALLPKEVSLPIPAHRQVASELVARREFPVLDVVEALKPLAQPELLSTNETTGSLAPTGEGETIIDGLISPFPLKEQ